MLHLRPSSALRPWSTALVALPALLTALTAPARAAEAGPWGPIAKVRDDTAAHAMSKPSGGWYVAPIHGVLQARDGKVILTGTKRIGEQSCNGTTQRNHGISFVLDPAKLDAVEDGDTLLVEPIPEQARDERHVLYCSGHVPLADGRILYVAGTDYPRALPITSPELGLTYSRLFDPEQGKFTRIDADMKGGPAQSPGMKWYPTNRLLPDGRVLIAGGYHWSVGGPGDKENRSLEIFDPAIWDEDPSADPYTVLSQPADIPGTLNQPGRAYTHVFLLPKPVPAAKAGGWARTVALVGSVGEMWLFNHEAGPSAAQRIRKATNAMMPRSGADKGEGSTSVMLPDGKILIMNGGRDGAGSARAYFYDPQADEWDTLDLGIGRIFSTATWLPDGTVLLLNGYTNEPGSPWSLDGAPGGADGVRRPQLIDPFAKTVKTEEPWPETTARGYHSFALLLKDGRVLIGGGKDNVHDTGCEKNELRIYSPPYLSAGPRPQIKGVEEGQQLMIGGAPLTIQFSGNVRAERGVALLAPGAVTHSYNQNQLYLPLRVLSGPKDGEITVAPPATVNEAPPGEYLLHLVSEEGVPSVGTYVRVVAAAPCVYPLDAEEGVFIEAEGSSRRAGPFRRVAEEGRGNDAFLEVDPAAPSATDVPDEGHVAWYDLDVAEGGSIYAWLLGSGPDTSSDTVFLSVNGGTDRVVTLPETWGWVRTEMPFTVPAGKSTLKLKAGKPGARIDRIWLSTEADSAPEGLGAAAPETPCSMGPVVDPSGGGGSGGAAGASSAAGNAGMSTGGTSAAGGASAVGGSTSAAAGAPSATPPAASSESGCGCRTVAASSNVLLSLLGLVPAALGLARRRRRRERDLQQKANVT